ncbi:unnamed protein product, partial [Allacma fusca]
MGVKVKTDRPGVGHNLQDHVSVLLGPFLMTEPKSILVDRDLTPRAFLRYLLDKQGPLTTTGHQAIGITSSEHAKENGEGDWPDLVSALTTFGIHKWFPAHVAHYTNINTEVSWKYWGAHRGQDAFHVVVSVGRPKSKGWIGLKSTKPLDKSWIDPQYYQDYADINRTIEAINMNLRLVEETEAFRSVGAQLASAAFPGCENRLFRSDEYWECYIRHMSISQHHFVGTAAMGKSDNRHAVVDPELRVIGVRNLRVVDASVMPVIPVAGTQAACLMIGEKAADLIKETWATPSDTFVPIEPNDSFRFIKLFPTVHNVLRSFFPPGLDLAMTYNLIKPLFSILATIEIEPLLKLIPTTLSALFGGENGGLLGGLLDGTQGAGGGISGLLSGLTGGGSSGAGGSSNIDLFSLLQVVQPLLDGLAAANVNFDFIFALARPIINYIADSGINLGRFSGILMGIQELLGVPPPAVPANENSSGSQFRIKPEAPGIQQRSENGSLRS